MPDSEQLHLDRLARSIESADSPVGIDARKTHVLILRALERIEERLERLERRVAASPGAEGTREQAPVRMSGATTVGDAAGDADGR